MNRPELIEWLTWKQFRDKVLSLMPVDKKRVGSDAQDYLLQTIRQAVLDLQSYIKAYRIGHETVYFPTDFVTEGTASRGVLPPGAHPRDFKYCEIDEDKRTTKRRDMEALAWDNRFSMVHAVAGLNCGLPVYSIDPYGYTFYVFPEIVDGAVLSLFWDGIKIDFQETDKTPFDEPMAMAVAAFARAYVSRDIEKDLAGYGSYIKTYEQKRRTLYLDAGQRKQMSS